MYQHYEIRPKVFAIEDGDVRMYLVCGSTRALLLDTGYGSSDLKSYLQSIYSGPILVAHTHTHGDHIGADRYFDEIYVSPFEQDALIDSGVPSFSIYPLCDGDVFDLGDRKITVHKTPGHTVCSLCFADHENRILFTGDNISDATVYLSMPGADIQKYCQSLQWILEQQANYDAFLGCHGQAIQTPENAQRLLSCVQAAVRGDITGEKTHAFADIYFDKYTYNGASIFLPLSHP